MDDKEILQIEARIERKINDILLEAGVIDKLTHDRVELTLSGRLTRLCDRDII